MSNRKTGHLSANSNKKKTDIRKLMESSSVKVLDDNENENFELMIDKIKFNQLRNDMSKNSTYIGKKVKQDFANEKKPMFKHIEDLKVINFDLENKYQPGKLSQASLNLKANTIKKNSLLNPNSSNGVFSFKELRENVSRLSGRKSRVAVKLSKIKADKYYCLKEKKILNKVALLDTFAEKNKSLGKFHGIYGFRSVDNNTHNKQNLEHHSSCSQPKEDYRSEFQENRNIIINRAQIKPNIFLQYKNNTYDLTNKVSDDSQIIDGVVKGNTKLISSINLKLQLADSRMNLGNNTLAKSLNNSTVKDYTEKQMIQTMNSLQPKYSIAKGGGFLSSKPINSHILSEKYAQ